MYSCSFLYFLRSLFSLYLNFSVQSFIITIAIIVTIITFFTVSSSPSYTILSLSLSAAMDLGGHLFTFIYLTFIFIFIFTFVDASFISVKKSDNFFEQYFDFWLSLINQTADDIHTNINEQNNISAKCKNDVIYFIDSAQNRSSWALKSKCFVFNFFVLLFLTGLYIIIMFFYYINILILRSK